MNARYIIVIRHPSLGDTYVKKIKMFTTLGAEFTDDIYSARLFKSDIQATKEGTRIVDKYDKYRRTSVKFQVCRVELIITG